MPRGYVKRWFNDKAFGFITPDDSSHDVFAPARTFSGDETTIREGMKVHYEFALEERTGKQRATSWDAIDGDRGNGYGAHRGGGNHRDSERYSPYGGPPPGGGYPPAGGYGAPPLPPGWEPVVDRGSGRTYFWNRATNETSWHPPMGGPPPHHPMPPHPHHPAPGYGPPPLPYGWEQIPDPASGRPYFCNRATGETSWTPPGPSAHHGPPPAHHGPPPTGAPMPAPSPAPSAAPPPGPRREDWEQATDPASGKPYYINHATGQTSWTRPGDGR